MYRLQAGIGSAGILLTIAGQWLIVGVVKDGDRWGTGQAGLALGVWLAGVALVVGAVGRPALAEVPPPPAEHSHGEWWPAAVGVALVANGLLLARGADWDARPATACWLVAMVAVLAGARLPQLGRPWRSRLQRPSRHGWAALVVVAAAGAVRLTALGSHPNIVDGDEAGHALLARDVARGRLTDPFATGYLDHPTLFAFVQRASMALAGDSLAGARLASATAGTAAVGVTYLLARRLAGPAVGLTAAGVLSVLPVHVHFSRLALNNVFDSLTLATALWLVIRAVDEQRRLDAAAAGIVIGLGQYFYFTSPLVAAVVAAFALWRGIEAVHRGVGRRRIASLWMWMAAAAITAYVPLGVHYLQYPATFNPRGTLVLLIGDGVAARQARTGSSLGAVLAENIGRSLLSPFGSAGFSTYHPGPPVIGWAFAVPLAIGIASCTVGARRSSAGLVALVWLAALVAVGLTVSYPVTRWVFATPILAIAIAHGLHAGWRSLAVPIDALGGPPPIARAVRLLAVGVGVLAISASALVGEFTGPALRQYGDGNSLVATRLADELAGQPPGTAVFALMAPRMWLDSHHVRQLAAPQIVGVDVADPLTATADVPAIDGRTAFVFLPERLAELDVVRRRFPGGTLATRSVDGLELYTVYWVEPAGFAG